MNNNPVGWFEIYVQDMERAKRFYESVFQTKLERLDSPASMPVELWSFRMLNRPGF
jgi:predicted enzyme related to lactoylglutathione lyase